MITTPEPCRMHDSQPPTLSIKYDLYSDGSWGVEVYVTGLTSEAQAVAAANFIQQALGGDEIGGNQ